MTVNHMVGDLHIDMHIRFIDLESAYIHIHVYIIIY